MKIPLTNQQLTDPPNPTDLALKIYSMQLPKPSPQMTLSSRPAILLTGGFFCAEETPDQLHSALSRALLEIGDKLLAHRWETARRALLAFDPAIAAASAHAEDMLCRLRAVFHRGAPPALVRRCKRTYPATSLPHAWNTTLRGRWRREQTARAALAVESEAKAEEERTDAIARMSAQLAVQERRARGYTPLQLHRIANAQLNRDGPNADWWVAQAEAAARAEGFCSRFDLDEARINRRNAEHLAVQVRQHERALNNLVRRLRAAANKAQRAGDTTKAQALRQQAADIRRTAIDPSTGETIVTHQPPAHRPSHLHGTHGGARVNAGGRRPGAGRKRLFAATPPEPDPSVTAHADPAVSLARRWSHHAAWLAAHFTYHASTGTVTGPSGQALDLRHPVSTPLGALRPGLLLAALLHGTVTRRYSLPRGTGAASVWPLHTLAVAVVDAERDSGVAQPGTPAHLLVPPAPRVRRGGGR